MMGSDETLAFWDTCTHCGQLIQHDEPIVRMVGVFCSWTCHDLEHFEVRNSDEEVA